MCVCTYLLGTPQVVKNFNSTASLLAAPLSDSGVSGPIVLKPTLHNEILEMQMMKKNKMKFFYFGINSIDFCLRELQQQMFKVG